MDVLIHEAIDLELLRKLVSSQPLLASIVERHTTPRQAAGVFSKVLPRLAVFSHSPGTDTPPSQRALKFFDWVVQWAESKDFRGCPLQHTVSELTDAAHRRAPLRTVSESGSLSVSANGRRRRE